MALVLVGILLSLFGDPSITLFAIGLAVVGAGTVVLTALFCSALGRVEDLDARPDAESWRSFSAPGSGTWVYPGAAPEGGERQTEHYGHETAVTAGAERAQLQA
jgi:hypothetical protein